MTKPMSLIGGIETYSILLSDPPKEKRYQSDKSPYGRKVYFLNENGYQTEREHACDFFDTGQELTVKEIYVGRSSSQVEFVEYSNKKFNTVMFADKKEEEETMNIIQIIQKEVDEICKKEYKQNEVLFIVSLMYEPSRRKKEDKLVLTIQNQNSGKSFTRIIFPILEESYGYGDLSELMKLLYTRTL